MESGLSICHRDVRAAKMHRRIGSDDIWRWLRLRSGSHACNGASTRYLGHPGDRNLHCGRKRVPAPEALLLPGPVLLNLVELARIELATPWLQTRCSPTELQPHLGCRTSPSEMGLYKHNLRLTPRAICETINTAQFANVAQG